MLKDSFATAEADMKARALAEARLDADRMLLATQGALDADGQLLSAAQRAEVDALMAQLRQTAADSQDAAAIEAAAVAAAVAVRGADQRLGGGEHARALFRQPRRAAGERAAEADEREAASEHGGGTGAGGVCAFAGAVTAPRPHKTTALDRRRRVFTTQSV